MKKRFIDGIKKGMHLFGQNISVIVNTILLAFVYIIGIGIPALIAKLSKKKFLQTEKKEDSYWKDLHLGKRPKQDYFRQF